jgi:HTH-type transcriptional regulator / antitoxin HipB
MSLIVFSPLEVSEQLADRIRRERLARGWTQADAAARAGMPLPTYRLFERTGKISLQRLLALASAFGRLAEWDAIFAERSSDSLEQLVTVAPTRKRGRRRKGS